MAAPQLASSSYLSADTIAAAATALGGPVAMIRVSGPRAFEACGKLCRGSSVLENLEARKLARVALFDSTSGAQLDDAMVARFIAPESYTGEDVVELHVHGG